jgi:preprotein translocase subunit SecE
MEQLQRIMPCGPSGRLNSNSTAPQWQRDLYILTPFSLTNILGTEMLGDNGLISQCCRAITAPDHITGVHMARFNPMQFIQQTRAEVSKVVWPNRRETTITTIMVFIMASVAAIFFFAVDQIIKLLQSGILG